MEKLKNIKLLLLDVDGVLTNGQILFTDSGEEIKAFYAKDGLGIKLLVKNNIKVGVLTARYSKALRHRCKDLGIEPIFEGVQNKASVLGQLKDMGICEDEIIYVGDDIIDLPIMRKIGVSVAVADAHPLVIKAADIVTYSKGGFGAVREVCEIILKAKNLWEKILENF